MKYKVKGVSKTTGEDAEFTIEAIDFREAEKKVNELGYLVSNVSEIHKVSAGQLDSGSTSEKGVASCVLCGARSLRKVSEYRMSVPVVAIGYILLIPSVFGILLNAFILLTPIFGIGSTNLIIDEATVQVLQEAKIDSGIIYKLENNEMPTQQELDSLSRQQKEIVAAVITTNVATKAGACCGLAIVGGGALVGLILSFVGGLLGWLLIMKKKALKCVVCGAAFSG